jgi:hypothetical protein
MRTLTLAALVVALLAPTNAEAKDASTCSFQTVEAGTWTAYENELTIRCFAREFGVDPDYAVAIASRESGLNERAWNRTTDCRGLFQHLGRYWLPRVATYSRLLDRYAVKSTSAFNPRANSLVAMAMVRAGGWGPWTTAY